MPIQHFKTTHFRNLSQISLEAHSQFNIIYGANGSGKTSLLEAIYYLSRGRSFRTQLVNRIMQHDSEGFSIFSELKGTTENIKVGIERGRGGLRKIRFNGESIHSMSTIARHLPVQLTNTESYRLFHDGPKIRRQFLDWGLFHVEPTFFSHWQQLQHILKQRNACLKNNNNTSQISFWDSQLSEIATEIEKLRKPYVETLTPLFYTLLDRLIENHQITLHYKRGWEKEKDLATVLKDSFDSDRHLGYTQYGPQRADLAIRWEKTPVQDFLSKGQQKLTSYALLLAQGKLLQEKTGKASIYLIDDLPSELDSEKRLCITETLVDLDSQVFITANLQQDLSDCIDMTDHRLFHVEHGTLSSNTS